MQRRQFAEFAIPQPVAHADRDALEFVEHVELGDHQAVEAVDRGRIAQQRGIEPAAAARPPGDGAKLVAALADLVAFGAQGFGGKRPPAHARDVGFGYSDYAGDPRGRHAGSGAGAARAGAR